MPLPYFANPKPPNTAPARLRETYNYPRIYTSQQEKQRPFVISSLSGWSSPSIINFNPSVDLPEIRPVSRICAPTGSIIGVQNKSHTGTVAIVAALDATATPPATAQSEAIQQGLDSDENNEQIITKPKSPDIDSLYSEGELIAATSLNANNKSNKHLVQQSNTVNDQNGKQNVVNSQENTAAVDSLASAFSFQFNVTDESGQVNDAEIYDPDSRGRDKRKINQLVNRKKKKIPHKQSFLFNLCCIYWFVTQ